MAFSKVQASGAEHHREAWLQVIGWNNYLTEKDYMKLATMYENGENISDYKGVNVEGYEVSSDLSEEDLKASADEEEINHDEENNNTVHKLPEKTADSIQQIVVGAKKEKVKVSASAASEDTDEKQKEIKVKDLGDEPF